MSFVQVVCLTQGLYTGKPMDQDKQYDTDFCDNAVSFVKSMSFVTNYLTKNSTDEYMYTGEFLG